MQGTDHSTCRSHPSQTPRTLWDSSGSPGPPIKATQREPLLTACLAGRGHRSDQAQLSHLGSDQALLSKPTGEVGVRGQGWHQLCPEAQSAD